ncbi:unnamed protein product [Allacma fusca]|uniref:Uncharacterized protein n=1 Tax=Allacma fusca TaxID=39272 RepID=A0A8J2K641_9HEXA|nr:unnamed protein product [Allacma fusca]
MSGSWQNVGTSSETPTSDEITDLITAINQLRESLKAKGETNATLEIFRDRLANLYLNTVEPNFLRIHLYQLRVLSEYDNRIVAKIKADVKMCEKMYSYVFMKGAVTELIIALQNSGNSHIIFLLRDIVREKFESFYGIHFGENMPTNLTSYKNCNFGNFGEDRILQECKEVRARLKIMESKNRKNNSDAKLPPGNNFTAAWTTPLIGCLPVVVRPNIAEGNV